MNRPEGATVARLLGRRRQRAEDFRLRLEDLEESARENDRLSGDLEARVSELGGRVTSLAELRLSPRAEDHPGREE